MTGHPIPDPGRPILSAVGGWDLADECSGMLTTPHRPTCLHVLASILRRNGVVQVSARSVCPACLAALAGAVDSLGLEPAVDWPAEPAAAPDWAQS